MLLILFLKMAILHSQQPPILVFRRWFTQVLAFHFHCLPLCIPAANKYPKLKIVLAHAGGGIVSAEAQVAASVCGNLYLETSWCIGEDIRWMINTIGSDRVMMGADLPSNVPTEFAKYKALDLAPEVYDKVMGGTAINVFNLNW